MSILLYFNYIWYTLLFTNFYFILHIYCTKYWVFFLDIYTMYFDQIPVFTSIVPNPTLSSPLLPK